MMVAACALLYQLAITSWSPNLTVPARAAYFAVVCASMGCYAMARVVSTFYKNRDLASKFHVSRITHKWAAYANNHKLHNSHHASQTSPAQAQQ
jgi:hypothetical protein